MFVKGGKEMKNVTTDYRVRVRVFALPFVLLLLSSTWAARGVSKVEQVEFQPLAAQVKRLVEALNFLGAPLRRNDELTLEKALKETDAARATREIQNVLDRYSLVEVHISPESRVKVTRGQAPAELMEHGWRTFLIKVRNEAGITAPLRAESLHALPGVYPQQKVVPARRNRLASAMW
jgi:hypothetical protein